MYVMKIKIYFLYFKRELEEKELSVFSSIISFARNFEFLSSLIFYLIVVTSVR